jgi:hypothetical protein
MILAAKVRVIRIPESCLVNLAVYMSFLKFFTIGQELLVLR